LIVGRKSQRFGETQRIGLSPVSGMRVRQKYNNNLLPFD
jgi:hypothetical protein